MICDTHTHLYLEEFDADGHAEAVDRATAAGVGMMVMPNVSVATIEPMRRLHALRPATTCMAMGLHPTEVDAGWQESLEAVHRELTRHRSDYCAIGEVGIDLYWDATWRLQQRLALAQQAQWAGELQLPLIIHCRDGLDDTLEVLGSLDLQVPVVMHSFSGDVADVRRVRRVLANPWFGINGVVTFKNSSLRNTLPEIGLDRMLLETDSPYLSPVPKRGRRNESAFIVHTAQFVAQTLGVSPEEVAAATYGSAKQIFKF